MTRSAVLSLRADGVDYGRALSWQRDAAESVRQGGREAVALIEHDPVYTMGRRGGRASLLVPQEFLRAPLYDIERGGDLTWHGPGQLVGYPILALGRRRMHAGDYVHRLEAVLIAALAGFGIAAGTVPGRPGVWVGDAKIAAIGVAVRGGVSMHGFALNVQPDLGWFDSIVPCGLSDASVTSMERILGEAPAMDTVVEAVSAVFEDRFDVHLEPATAEALRALGAWRTAVTA